MACTALASGEGGVKHFRKVLARGGVRNLYFGGGRGAARNFGVKIKIA